jgi:diguanylate cyclase (GGDEF)-like protein
MLLDIDFFKKFNDTHGHQVGDEVLRQVAKTLRNQAREMDLPCRYGGEEFAVILPATDGPGACSVAERVRKAVEDSVTECDGKTLKVTCSLGLSEVRPGDDPARIIRRADDALYQSKKAGRNCGHWTDGESYFPISMPETAPAVEAVAEDVVPPAAGAAAPTTHATFIHVLKRRVTESHRFGVPLSVMLLKIDDFDSVCNSDGTSVAGQIVDTVEPALEKALREMDVLARMENGEFVVMLPGKTQAEAGQVLKRMRITTSQCAVPLKDREFNVRFRHGIAELKPNETAQELLARARQAASATAISRQSAEARPQPTGMR